MLSFFTVHFSVKLINMYYYSNRSTIVYNMAYFSDFMQQTSSVLTADSPRKHAQKLKIRSLEIYI